MANIKELIYKHNDENVLSIINTAGALGKKEDIEVYVVGGFVRDLIMRKPINDIDIMIVGDGIKFAKKLAELLGVKKIVPFKKFGTALIPNQKIPIEVASARTEKYSNDSRKPSKVLQTGLKEDLLRRDFTINAMAMDIRPEKFGELTDPFQGVHDINKQIIKTPLSSDETFSEDPLRMMRAAYFSSKLGFKIDEECIESIKKISGRINIYTLFLYKCIGLLRPGGILSFVIPPSILNGAYFEKIRHHIIATCNIIEISHVTGQFLDTGISVMIFTIQKLTTDNTNNGNFIVNTSSKIFSDQYIHVNSFIDGTKTINQLNCEVKTGKIVWNQHKDELVDKDQGGKLLIQPQNGCGIHLCLMILISIECI